MHKSANLLGMKSKKYQEGNLNALNRDFLLNNDRILFYMYLGDGVFRYLIHRY